MNYFLLFILLFTFVSKDITSAPVCSPSSVTVCSLVPVTILLSGCATYTSVPAIPGISMLTNSGSLVVSSYSATIFIITGYDVSGVSCGSTSFVYNINAAPTYTVTSSSTNICLGESAVISSSNTSYNYTWSPSTSLSSATGSSVVATPTADVVYTIEATDASTGCTTSSVLPLYVGQYPVLSLPNGNSITKCQGDYCTVIVRRSGLGGIIAFPPAMVNQVNDSTYLLSTISSTLFSFLPFGPTGCIGPVLNFNLSVTPIFPINITASNGAGPVCLGQSATLSATAISGLSYAWSPHPTLMASSATSAVVTPTTTTTYTLNVSGNGCAFQYFYTKSVLTDLPSLTLNTNNVFVCPNTNFNIIATHNAGSTLTWSPIAAIDTLFGSTASVSPTVTTTYTAFATNTNGCQVSSACTVSVLPQPTFTLSGGSTDSICAGSVALVQASNNAITYSALPFQSSTTYNNVSKTFTFQPTTTTTYSINGTNGSCNSVRTVKIIVFQPVVINTPVQSHRLCPGQALFQDINEVVGNNATTYSWAPSATVAYQVPNGGEVYLAPNITTTYTVTGQNGACVDTAQLLITLVSNPTFTVPFASATILQGNAHNFISISNGITFHWQPAEGVSDTTIRNPVLTPSTSTVYTIHAYGAFGQCATKRNFTLNVTPIRDEAMLQAIENVYPNPANEQITILLKTNSTPVLQLFDSKGLLIKSIETNNNTQIEVSLAGLTAGLYYLRLLDEEHSKTYKFLKLENK